MSARLCRELPVAGRQVHHAKLAATMPVHGEPWLLTFNTDDFRGFGERIELIDRGAAP